MDWTLQVNMKKSTPHSHLAFVGDNDPKGGFWTLRWGRFRAMLMVRRIPRLPPNE